MLDVDMLLVSVIIPTYKPGKYIEECLKSVFYQSLSPISYEVIIILNGDLSENYVVMIDEILQNKPTLLVCKFCKTTELGVSNARNIGLENSVGEFICFIDDDDVISFDYLEGLLSIANENIVAVSNVYSFKENIIEKETNFFICDKLKNKEKYEGRSLFVNRSFLSFPVAKIFHRSIIGNRRFDIRFKNGEDALFVTSISDKIQGISFANEEVVYYVRERQGSASRKKISRYEIFKTTSLLIVSYCSIFLSSIRSYSLLLFLSRIPGVLKNAYILLKNR
ncbi:glycosyltransferase family 2 protein [Phocaeicola sp.]